MRPLFYHYATALGPGKSTAQLSAFHNGLSVLSAPMLLLAFPHQCYISMLPAGGKLLIYPDPTASDQNELLSQRTLAEREGSVTVKLFLKVP
jgi:hypothetical protein